MLDTLYRHPNTPERPVLLEAAASALYSFNPLVPMPWLFRTWVEEGVLPSLWHAPRPGPRPSTPETVTLTPVDVEGDGSLEWLVTVSICASPPLPHLAPYGDLLVVWPAEQQHISLLDALSTYHFPDQSSSGPHRLPEVKGVDDLTGDGRPEIVLLYRSAGATTDLERLYVLSWGADGFRDLVTTTWEPQNGGWSVADLNGDHVAELIGEDRGPGSAAAGPFPPYQLIYELVHDEYVPTRIHPLFPTTTRPDSAEHLILLWREANLFARTGFRQEALDRLQELATLPPRHDEGIPDLRPYALFRLGFLAGLWGDMTSLRTWWRRLIREFPTHPVSTGVSQWLNAVHAPDDLGIICGQLNETEGRWVEESLDALWYPLALDWRDLCAPSLLFPAWPWPRPSSLDALLSRRGFRWQPVTAEYDLNADGIPDPIGTVTGPCATCTTDTHTLWAFLSADQQYFPLLVTRGQPPEALWPPWDWPPESSTGQCELSATADLNGDGFPELITLCPQRIILWTWTGHRFRPFTVSGVRFLNGQFVIFAQRPRLVRDDQNTFQLEITFFSPELSFTHLYRFTGSRLHLVASTEDLPSESLSSAALRLLFDEQDPAGALTLLTATPSVPPATATPTDPAVRRALTYAQALAHEYVGQATQAAVLYRRLAEEPRSPWAPKARRRLDSLCAQRTC